MATTITLYTGQSPNGIKISIALEELGLSYNTRKIDMTTNEQKSDWFTKINPNGRIPAITDTYMDGQDIHIFESGSILQYLASRYDKDHKISYPPGTREHVVMTNWLFFQNAGIGPMQGQANHFFRYSGQPIQYAIDRYQGEVRRLYGIVDKHLKDSASLYLVGDKCTIADISLWGWVTVARWAGIELSEFPVLMQWEARMFKRPAVEKGRQVPDKHHRELLQDPEAMAAFEQRGRDFYKKLAQDEAEAKHT
ncbi:hypothetical protein AMS68_004205 [Peltaster fructicola]|uniref:Glutathione S-transferase n=1 Tax=Peltaster fructicola TaxID=286661 RepID=A0A6H0XVQ3_9PEZI|nr:hypothetical protein AMS68_004205 [Peltaster fructicola]